MKVVHVLKYRLTIVLFLMFEKSSELECSFPVDGKSVTLNSNKKKKGLCARFMLGIACFGLEYLQPNKLGSTDPKKKEKQKIKEHL